MELMGHSTIQMTMRYAHLVPEHAQSAVEKLVLGGSGEMANTLALGASAARLAGSSPAFRTTPKKNGLATKSATGKMHKGP
jgi:hypothetical protein